MEMTSSSNICTIKEILVQGAAAWRHMERKTEERRGKHERANRESNGGQIEDKSKGKSRANGRVNWAQKERQNRGYMEGQI